MKETLKRMKADVILSAILCIALGIVLIVWSEETIQIICRVLAVGLIVMGAVNLVGFFTDRMKHPFSGALGLVVLLIGVWIFISPENIASLIPIVIGVILILHGLQDIKYAIEAKKCRFDKWWGILLMAALSLIFGVISIVHAFGLVKLAMMFIGFALVYDGISDLIIVLLTTKVMKQMRQDAEALDVDYKEID